MFAHSNTASVSKRVLGALCLLLPLLLSCAGLGGGALTPAGLATSPVDNPMLVPVTDSEFLWLQLVDTVDDYFRILQEQRPRQIGGVVTEGRIDTVPQIGSTIFEPWKQDSTPGFERLHATLQTVRRQATVRAIPSAGGYLIEVIVVKELEDLERPELSTVGARTRRHDNSLGDRQDILGDPARVAWIPLGRDVSLENEILLALQQRLAAP